MADAIERHENIAVKHGFVLQTSIVGQKEIYEACAMYVNQFCTGDGPDIFALGAFSGAIRAGMEQIDRGDADAWVEQRQELLSVVTLRLRREIRKDVLATAAKLFSEKHARTLNIFDIGNPLVDVHNK